MGVYLKFTLYFYVILLLRNLIISIIVTLTIIPHRMIPTRSQSHVLIAKISGVPILPAPMTPKMAAERMFILNFRLLASLLLASYLEFPLNIIFLTSLWIVDLILVFQQMIQKPTAIINKIAMITSGNVRTKLNANFPVLAIVFPLLPIVSSLEGKGKYKEVLILRYLLWQSLMYQADT